MNLLTTDQVARRLGVRRQTVYAYVSRGLLVGRRNARGKESLFAEDDVEAFAAGRRQTAAEPPTAPAIHTGITLISDGELFYRGRSVRDLAEHATFEEVAGLLWTGAPIEAELAAVPAMRRVAARVNRALPPETRLTDRMRLTVAAVAAVDPLRFDLTPAAVVRTAASLLGTMVDVLPKRDGGLLGPLFAARLSRRLIAFEPPPETIDQLNTALVLLADHDIAASTLAARVAASTRAHPYAVVGAGLAALDGPLHGAASGLAHRLLTDAIRSGDPFGTVADRLRAGETIPGFGHRLYPYGDPRAAILLARLDQDVTAVHGADEIAAVAETVTERTGIKPNVDFALAAFTVRHGLPAETGEVIFALARTAGWVAHALEEYADRPLRFRPTGRYSA